MDVLEKPKKKQHVKLGFTHVETTAMVEKFNDLLANYHVHYQKLRNYHWNVEGPDFFDLHEKFEAQYNEAKLNIDEIAERIRVFGKKPVSTMKEYLEMSEIKEMPNDMHPDKMVKDILNDYEILLSYMVEVTDEAANIGDTGTIDMINAFIKNMETSHWMFTSFLSRKYETN